ncbi:MAG: hypothetical protein K2O37_01835 [Bacteroidales bacterium]|nr:hypothetical protein [Bacteroidales bacterium]
MKVDVIVEQGIDGSYDANMEYVESVPFGLLGQGNTATEAIADFKNSYEEIKAILQSAGEPCPVLEFDFKIKNKPLNFIHEVSHVAVM